MIIGSDADWQYCEGAYTFNNIYLGERLDMKLFRGDNTTDLLMPDWKNVVLSNGPEGVWSRVLFRKLTIRCPSGQSISTS